MTSRVTAFHATAYPNSERLAKLKFGESEILSCSWPRRNTLRRQIAAWMVEVHRIAPKLADYHVSQMDFEELRLRVKHYAGMELSAVGPKPKSAADFYPVFGVATTTAGRPALNPVSGTGEGAPV